MEIISMNGRDRQWKMTLDQNGYEWLAEYQCWEDDRDDTIEFTLLRRKMDGVVVGCIRQFDGIDGSAPSVGLVKRVFPDIQKQLEADGHPNVTLLTSREVLWTEGDNDPLYKVPSNQRVTKVKA